MTATIGYPVHAVRTYSDWQNDHGVWITRYATACGREDSTIGRAPSVFGDVLSARRLELCEACFPGRSHRTYHPAPERVS